MKYDFDSVISRRGTNSYKWNCGESELPMWVADMDFRVAPEILEAIQKRLDNGILGYSDIPEELYRVYTEWWDKRHGFSFKKEDVIFSTGVIPIISSCVRKLTTPAENVVILTPVYNIFVNSIVNNGRNVLACPLIYRDGGYSIDMDALESALSDPQTSLMIFCNPQNPAGKIWDAETLRQVGELAWKHGVTVISDEIHCDITDPGKEYVPFASVSEHCRMNSVTCIAPTKAFNMAGIHSAAAVVPEPHLRHKVWRALNTDEVAEPNAFAVQATVAAFTRGGEWLDQMREYVFENKKAVGRFLEERVREIKLVRSEATYLLWLDCGALGIDSRTLADGIRAATGLWLTAGEEYGNGDRFLRMNIACPRSLLEDGLSRLEKYVKLRRNG